MQGPSQEKNALTVTMEMFACNTMLAQALPIHHMVQAPLCHMNAKAVAVR